MRDSTRRYRWPRRSLIVTFGSLLVVAGGLVEIARFVQMRESGMPMSMSMGGFLGMDGPMWIGMGLAAAGIGFAAWGTDMTGSLYRPGVGDPAIQTHALDSTPLSWRHIGLVAILSVALVIDTMKPATLAFASPGAAAEYGLPPKFVALWWPLTAFSGTVLGSFLWGRIGDRSGRRTSLTVATLFFMATAICGTMPSFGWNLCMCFLMGMAAGGMLPVVFTLMAELLPSKHRGWLSVLVGGCGTVGGYLAASGSAFLLEPAFGWRVLWLLGLPTGLALLVLIVFVPESPRHLLARGEVDEANKVLERFGAKLDVQEPAAAGVQTRGRIVDLVKRPHLGSLAGLSLYAVGWGLVNFGFLTWLPTIMKALGLSSPQANLLLSRSAVLAVPGVVLMVFVYARTRTNWALAGGAISIALSLVGIGLFHPAGRDAGGLLVVALGVLLATLGGSNAALAVYSAEVFPTRLRGTGAGVVAGGSKVGGVLGPPVVALLYTASPGLPGPAFVFAIPLAVAGVLLWARGPQTRGRALEEISSAGG